MFLSMRLNVNEENEKDEGVSFQLTGLINDCLIKCNGENLCNVNRLNLFLVSKLMFLHI